ncbi:E3 ubiquitin-protein ligase RMND5A-like [Gigantopelta aegis]|uniref:E3 ubiquitin-protein ligase RMND5A-like n=1 Tax=Gigantopelta aegis TaxID=1735272 RepID=UPI001B88E13F|nr:E3 ubiquitin-protein ligase RMND5A-like [Gigantopelta aegis]
MDCCTAVEREIDKVLSKFTCLQDHTNRTIGELINSIQSIRNELLEVPDDQELTATQALILSQSVKRIREAVSRMSTEHKDLHGSVSKVGKAVDRNFVSDFSVITTDGAFDGETKIKLLNEVIAEHFLRQGMLDVAEALNEDAMLHLDNARKEPFLELHRILGALKVQDLRPALEWAEANRQKLMEQNSSLEFKLHRLYFVDLIRRGPENQVEALMYTRNFAPFANQHVRELQILMGSLLYLKQGLENSPYVTLLDPIYWEEICDVFTRDACSLMGLSVESPLSVSIRAGCHALPPLLSIRQVMNERRVPGVWANKDELPVEIDMGMEYIYHSTFACPILRQQSTDNNPPLRLVCGHVISRDALNKLANGNKVKCPYCPVEQLPSEAKQIFF